MQTLNEQLPAAKPDKNLQDRQLKVERWLKIVSGSGISILVGGILGWIIYQIIIGEADVLAGLLFLGLIVGIVLFAVLMLYRESLLKATSQSPTPPTLPQAAETANLLSEAYIEHIPSVTDRTTELLMVEKRDGAK